MLQGMFGKRLAEHFSLLESSSLVLGPKGNSQVALTRMRMPNGFPGPTPHIPPEKAFSISVHLRRPDSIKGWGTWLDGRFHRVTEWDASGIQIFDMESEPVALRTSGFDSVHVYIPRSVINRFSDENEQKRVRNLYCTPGNQGRRDSPLGPDDVALLRSSASASTLSCRRNDHDVLRSSEPDIPGPEPAARGCYRGVDGLATGSSDRDVERTSGW